MNRTASRSALFLRFLLCPLPALCAGFVAAPCDVPRVAFSGAYGATAGAGALTGWGRHGADNPAVLGPAGQSVSLAGYAPFGLDGLQVMETSAAYDRARWGASMAWRGLLEDGHARASITRVQGAWKVGERLSAGGALSFETMDAASGGSSGLRAGAGLGLLWRPWSFLHFGVAAEGSPSSPRDRGSVGVGMDCGTRLGRDAAWRLSVEHTFSNAAKLFDASAVSAPSVPSEEGGEWRYGFGLRLYGMLSLYGGFAPARETASLGVRFGMGGFEGFSALRRHAALGGTSIQGLQWSRARE